tara:strand:+ start:2768 stop:3130 length:363 start_codon:yes stop_codon:yes gene_type:complete
MHPNGDNRNNDDHAIFSKEGPNLNNPEQTNSPSVIPNKYKLKNKNNNGTPNFKIEIPNNGEVKITAGTRPIKVLIKAVTTSAEIISLIFKGDINKFVKFLLQISSKKNILKLILDLKRMS